MSELATYLSQFDHITEVTPMTIGIRREIYNACSYLAKFTTPEQSPAYAKGERHYWQSFIYCIGLLPACYRNNTRVAFTIAGDPSDWYVSCYWPMLTYHRQNEFATRDEYKPFGPNFLLSPWNCSEPIDYYETNKRKRVPIAVTKL